MTTSNTTFRKCDAVTLTQQIGRGNLAAISGLRVIARPTGVTLPVGSGYKVLVDLAGNDTYTIQRIFTRGGKTWVKGKAEGIYADQVGETAYRASCHRNGPWGDGVEGYWTGK